MQVNHTEETSTSLVQKYYQACAASYVIPKLYNIDHEWLTAKLGAYVYTHDSI